MQQLHISYLTCYFFPTLNNDINGRKKKTRIDVNIRGFKINITYNLKKLLKSEMMRYRNEVCFYVNLYFKKFLLTH